MAAALLRFGAELAGTPSWFTLKAERTGFRTPGRTLWRVVVRAHGFLPFATVGVEAGTDEVERVGRTRLFELPPRGTAAFSVAVPERLGASRVAVTATSRGGRTSRRSIELGGTASGDG